MLEAKTLDRDLLREAWTSHPPAVFRGAAKRFRAFRNWTPEYLSEELADREVVVRKYDPSASASFMEQSFKESRQLKFPEYLKTLEEDPTWAIRESWELFEGTRLGRDLPLSRLLPGRELSCFLWCGPPAYVTGLHADLVDLNLLIHLWGRKHLTLFHPDQAPFLYVNTPDSVDGGLYSEVNVPQADLERFPLYSQASSLEVTLEPGDILFIPRAWWHYVVGEQVTLSVNAVQEMIPVWE